MVLSVDRARRPGPRGAADGASGVRVEAGDIAGSVLQQLGVHSVVVAITRRASFGLAVQYRYVGISPSEWGGPLPSTW